MDINDPNWETYETRFRHLAEQIELHKGPQPELAAAETMLFLYGENALTPAEEFATLAQLEGQMERLKGATMLTSYWEDIVLYTLP